MVNIKVTNQISSQISQTVAPCDWQNLKSRSEIFAALKRAANFSGVVSISKSGVEMKHIGKGRLAPLR